jgi:hypothetical protein
VHFLNINLALTKDPLTAQLSGIPILPHRIPSSPEEKYTWRALATTSRSGTKPKCLLSRLFCVLSPITDIEP